jgi:hypothetical protein
MILKKQHKRLFQYFCITEVQTYSKLFFKKEQKLIMEKYKKKHYRISIFTLSLTIWSLSLRLACEAPIRSWSTTASTSARPPPNKPPTNWPNRLKKFRFSSNTIQKVSVLLFVMCHVFLHLIQQYKS